MADQPPQLGVSLGGICVFHKNRWESGGEAVADWRSAGTCALPLPNSAQKWYAVHTRSRHEKVVAAQLRGRGVDTYLPLVEEIHRWSDRRKRVQVPLFPGYTFIHACDSAETMATVAQVPSAVGIVGAEVGGTPIPDEEIATVHRLLSNNIPCVNHPFLKLGQRVRIRGGALDGVEGPLLALKGENCLVVSIELIQRSVAVRIEGYDVEMV